MYVVIPLFPASVASVPITSSASYPGTSSMGILYAFMISFIIGTDKRITSGVSSLCNPTISDL